MYNSIISQQFGTDGMGNFIGGKPSNTVARIQVIGTNFSFDLKNSEENGVFYPSNNNLYAQLDFNELISQSNAMINISSGLSFLTTLSGYHHNNTSLVYFGGGYNSVIDSFIYNSGASGIVWILNQGTSTGYYCYNTFDIARHLGSNNTCTNKIATSVRLFYR